MKRVAILIIMLYGAFSVKGQSDKIDSLLLDLFENDKAVGELLNPPSFYLYSGFNFDNKSFYAGRELGNNMRVVTGNIYLFHSGGLYFGVSGAWYSQLRPSYASTVATSGYRTSLNKKHTLSARLSYSRYFFNDPDTVTQKINSNTLGAGLIWRNRWIGTRLSVNTMFGNDFRASLSSSVFADIHLWHYGERGHTSIDPEISIFLGPETILSESSGSLENSLATTFSTVSRYGLLNTQIYMPVCVYVGNFSFELGYSLNLPMTQDETADYPVSSYVSFTAGFLLPLEK